MIMVISNKKNKNNSKEFKELRMELSSMLMQTREELNKNIIAKIEIKQRNFLIIIHLQTTN